MKEKLHAVQRSYVQNRGPGSGSPLQQDLRSQMERFYGVGLGHVRVHSDRISRSRADDIGARAFTVGSDVFMGTDGLRATGADRSGLMAHEVAHTLQQGRGGTALQASSDNPRHGARQHECEANRMASDFNRFLTAGTGTQPQSPRAARLLSPAPAGAVQMSPVQTDYGLFRDDVYRPFQPDGRPIGVEMVMSFLPGERVNATHIGFTQAIRSYGRGQLLRTDMNRMLSRPEGQPGAGYHIDRLEGQPNPIYFTDNGIAAPENPDSITGYPERELEWNPEFPERGESEYRGWGSHGWRYWHDGRGEIRNAVMHDIPRIPASPKSEQRFETTAYAMAGAQEGMYYGSVEWGWRTDKNGVFSMLPFRRISRGVPSSNFMTAARIWNRSRVDFGYRTLRDTRIRIEPGSRYESIPGGTELQGRDRRENIAGIWHVRARWGRWEGWIPEQDVRRITLGAETIDLNTDTSAQEHQP